MISVINFKIAILAVVPEYSAGGSRCCPSAYQIFLAHIPSARFVLDAWSYIIRKPPDMALLMVPTSEPLFLIYSF